jgi:hypothetical protein
VPKGKEHFTPIGYVLQSIGAEITASLITKILLFLG